MRKTALIAIIWLFVFSGLCIAEDAPLGKKCKACRNVINDKRFAVIVESEEHGTLYFDDIGCALSYRATKCISTQEACDSVTRVFDYYTGEPVHIRAAYFVVSPSVKTPAGYGIFAFKEEKNARRFLSEHGADKVLDFEQVQGRIK